MSLLTNIEKTVKSWELGEFLENTVLGFIAFFLATTIHEIGHMLVAIALGCPANVVHTGFINGATAVGECTPFKMQFIALAGPLTAFLAGMYIWFTEHEDSKLRFLSIILFIISSVIQLLPVKPLDGYMAVYYGMNIVLELFLFLVVFSFSVNLIIDEIQDRKIWSKGE